ETERSSAPGQPATTPVMPPNPIRRETPGQDTPVLRQDTPAGVREASSTASTAAHPTDTRLAPAAANGPSPEDEKKSEGRISPTPEPPRPRRSSAVSSGSPEPSSVPASPASSPAWP